ncbi:MULTISPECIES: TOBE domain-containing protein [Methylomonas]|uniref:Molybdenum-dependent transcriptional regulator n=2 Tax=Methylomonas TaxID=416 RepID=A0A126T7C5_9GAMM|nr:MULTISPECIES: TOBE domain-containing protein [Methylomonas]AMK77930.1 molybdenum-dependent transcriptional regulator [Methylomonas denitrificans]OAI07762.1 molybdenum-dependent transcriptional regulator [Methylomonas methanica]TCV85462.1 molybdate transport system regulatory protein [Methylomonas methanica]
MSLTENNQNIPEIPWLEGELRLAGILDKRMIALLRAIEQSGSINQAAKQAGLSYKGAWQMIERANNLAPKVLIATAIGGSKGGGTTLTAAGLSLLNLFTRLEEQHRAFLRRLNQSLAADPDLMLLLKRQVIKTSARNQLFGTITRISPGSVNAEVFVTLKGGEQIVSSVNLSMLVTLNLSVGGDAVLLVNAPDIVVLREDYCELSARNRLDGHVIRVQFDGVDSEVIIQLVSGETIAATVTQTSAESLDLKPGCKASAVFKSSAVILAALSATGSS